MKRTAWNRLLSLLLAAVVTAALLPVPARAVEPASDTFGNGFSWSLDSEGTLAITGAGAMPNFFNDPPWAGRQTDIVKVTISEGVTSIGINTFWDCTSLTSAQLPSTLTAIEDGAFVGCTNLEQIILPDGLLSIGNQAFVSCTGLEQIILPDELITIGDYAFADCTSLEQITLPDKLTSIGASAFSGCTALTEVTFTSNPAPTLDPGIFIDSKNLTTIYYPADAEGYTSEEFLKYLPKGVTVVKGTEYGITVQPAPGGLVFASAKQAMERKTVTLTAVPDSGYRFTGWSAKPTVTFANVAGSETTFQMPASPVTVTAHFEVIPTYTVIFETGGGLPVPASQQVTDGEKATEPTPPTREGYVFQGWYHGSDKWDFAAAVTADITLTAKWEPIPTYTVTVNGGGADKASAAQGNTVSITAETPAGKQFVSWTAEPAVTFDNANSSSTSFTMPAGDVVVTARFADIPAPRPEPDAPAYAIDFPGRVEGGRVTISPKSARRGDRVTVTVTPDAGWELDTLTVTGRKGGAIALREKGEHQYAFTMPGSKVEIEVRFSKPAPPEPEPAPLPFADVPEHAWYAEAVRYVYEHGLMTGVAPARFEPDAPTSRGMIATILWRMAGSPDMEDEIWGYPYADVDATAYYGTAVYWARLNSIASGYSDETFGPGDPITREQLAVMLYRYLQSQGGGFTGAWAFPLDFADRDDASSYAYEALCWMTMHGVLTGTGGNRLNPQGQATRAEVAAMLTRFLTTIE